MIEAGTSLDSIITRVKELVAEIADADASEIPDDEALFDSEHNGDGLGLDSLDALKLGLALAEEYGLEPDIEIDSGVRTVRDAAEYAYALMIARGK